jgi:hypothetical protein
LASATAIWGSTFIVSKDATEQMSVLGFLIWRFGHAAKRRAPGRRIAAD